MPNLLCLGYGSDVTLPESALDAVVGCVGAQLLSCTKQPLAGGTGAATGSVTRLSGTAWCGDIEDPAVAAHRLGHRQTRADVPDLPWLSDDELTQRVAAQSLDWSVVDLPTELAEVWAARNDLLAQRADCHVALTHGDFPLGNLVAAGTATVGLDWGNLGVAPIGTDLAHLSLSAHADLVADYLAGFIDFVLSYR